MADVGAPKEDLKTIYKSYIRIVLEHNSVVCNFSMKEQNKPDLERVKKVPAKLCWRTSMKTTRNLSTKKEEKMQAMV